MVQTKAVAFTGVCSLLLLLINILIYLLT